MNFNDFITKALTTNSKAQYDALLSSEPTIRSDFSKSGSKYIKYSFIPKDNEGQFYDSISICFCSECEKTISDENNPCEDCFPSDHDDDF